MAIFSASSTVGGIATSSALGYLRPKGACPTRRLKLRMCIEKGCSARLVNYHELLQYELRLVKGLRLNQYLNQHAFLMSLYIFLCTSRLASESANIS